MFWGHGDRRRHTHMHMYTCMEDVCHTCSSLELASVGKYQATAGVESVCVECVCVCATTKIMHRILRCGTKHNIECKYMYVCLYIYVCISQEPRGVTTAWLASSRSRDRVRLALTANAPREVSQAHQAPASSATRASTVQTQVCLPSVSCVGDRCRPPITGAHLKSDWGTCGRQQDIQPYYVFGSGKWIATNHPFPQTYLFPVTGGKKFMKFKAHLTSATLCFS